MPMAHTQSLLGKLKNKALYVAQCSNRWLALMHKLKKVGDI